MAPFPPPQSCCHHLLSRGRWLLLGLPKGKASSGQLAQGGCRCPRTGTAQGWQPQRPSGSTATQAAAAETHEVEMGVQHRGTSWHFHPAWAEISKWKTQHKPGEISSILPDPQHHQSQAQGSPSQKTPFSFFSAHQQEMKHFSCFSHSNLTMVSLMQHQARSALKRFLHKENVFPSNHFSKRDFYESQTIHFYLVSPVSSAERSSIYIPELATGSSRL